VCSLPGDILTVFTAMTSFSVLGPGGVGGFVAGALHRGGHPVTIVARAPAVAHIRDHGLAVQSVLLGDFTAHPAAVETLTEPTDVLFVATKAGGLDAALERIATPPGLVVPLLNGLDHLARLKHRFGGDRVAAGVIRIESDRPSVGRIVQTSPSVRVDLAAENAAIAARLPALRETLDAAGIAAAIGPSEPQIMWSKLVRLNALASTTSVADRPIGEIRADPQWRATLIACLAETAATANADGASIDPDATLHELDSAHATLGSSMQRDLAAGREPELDAIQGAVLRAAARHGIAAPTVARLARSIAARAGLPAPA
jgi:2-dehydropantoate 2-reductase